MQDNDHDVKHKELKHKDKHYGLWDFTKDTVINAALARGLYREAKEYGEKGKKTVEQYAPQATSRFEDHHKDFEKWREKKFPNYYAFKARLPNWVKRPTFMFLTGLGFYTHFMHTSHEIEKSTGKFFRGHRKELFNFVDYQHQVFSPENAEIHKEYEENVVKFTPKV